MFSFREKCLHLKVSIKGKEEQFFKISMGVCIRLHRTVWHLERKLLVSSAFATCFQNPSALRCE